MKDFVKPNLLTMTFLFATAMKKWGAAGFPVVTWIDYNKRTQICHECTKKLTCPKCGCILWAKLALKTESCPEKKW